LQFTILFAACIAVASAGIIPAAAPLAAVAQVEEYDPHPQYTYGYDVKDAISGTRRPRWRPARATLSRASTR